MRRNTTDPMQWKGDDDDAEDMNMKLISLDNDLEDKHRINLDENIIVPVPSKKQRKKKRHKNKKINNNLNKNDNGNNGHHILDIDSMNDITSSILHDGDSELSSMDEDPTYDLNQYQSLTSFDLRSINSKYNASSSHHNINMHSQTPSYNTSHSYYPHSSYNQNRSSSKSCNDLYSRSAGFIPQNMDHFMCPEFSPLSPNIVHSNHNNIYSTQQTERILHLSPAKNQQKVNTTLQFLNDNNDNDNDTDIISDDNEDDDDDDVVPTPKNIDSISNSNLKMSNNNKLKSIDVDMMDKTKNNSSSSLQQTADSSKTMLLD